MIFLELLSGFYRHTSSRDYRGNSGKLCCKTDKFSSQMFFLEENSFARLHQTVVVAPILL